MAITTPKGEQIQFVSSKTGTHNLDTYLEAAEVGNRQISDLLDDMFDTSTGVFKADNFQFRYDATTKALQVRVGQFANSGSSWTEITPLFSVEGTFSSSTVYRNFDLVLSSAKDLYLINNRSADGTYASESSFISSPTTTKIVDVSLAQEWSKKTDGIVDSTDYSSKAWAIGGTGVTDTASKGAAKEWATKTSGTVDGTSYSAKHWATTGNVQSVVDNMTEITSVHTNMTAVTNVHTNMTQVTTVAAADTNITNLNASGVITNIENLNATDVINHINNLNATNVINNINNLNATDVLTNIGNLNATGVVNNITTTATNITNVNAFANTYHINTTSGINSASNVTAGDLFYNTTDNTLSVTYDGSAWSSLSGAINAIEQSEDYIVGTPKTANNGVSYDNSTTIFPATYNVGQIHVYLNGTKLTDSEYVATTGTDVRFESPLVALSVGDELAIVAFGSFAVANVYLKTQANALFQTIANHNTAVALLAPKDTPTFIGDINGANLILSGNLTVNGTTTTVNTTELSIKDNIITLNNDETGTPSQDAGIEIERGTATNASLLWDEGGTSGVWKAGVVGTQKQIFVDESDIRYKAINPDRQTQAAVDIDCKKSYNYRLMAAATENYTFSNYAVYGTTGYPITLFFLDRTASNHTPSFTATSASLVKWANNSEPAWADHRYWTVTFLSDGTNLFASGVGYT